MISVQDLCVRAGSFALDGISFEIPTGEYGILMGKTGCGKTTILEAICGLKSVVSGSIRLMSKEVVGLRPADRGIGFVPQDGALFSTLTIRQHLAFSLEVRKQSRGVIEKRVDELSELLGIGHLLERRPQGLSGGERQRVSLGRALAFEPGILCLDEPLSALDEDTRRETCELLASVREKTGVTTLHITHSLWEARQLADRVLVLEDGEISHRPADEWRVSTEES
jgi:ABC-type sugar transport system ATPase subunit